MSQPTLAPRVSALEQIVSRLAKSPPAGKRQPEKDWRSTIGMFTGDPIMKKVIDEGRRIRQRDREQLGE